LDEKPAMMGRSSSATASFSTIDASVTTSRMPSRADVMTSFRLDPRDRERMSQRRSNSRFIRRTTSRASLSNGRS
jgi:hypothetical protein